MPICMYEKILTSKESCLTKIMLFCGGTGGCGEASSESITFFGQHRSYSLVGLCLKRSEIDAFSVDADVSGFSLSLMGYQSVSVDLTIFDL